MAQTNHSYRAATSPLLPAWRRVAVATAMCAGAWAPLAAQTVQTVAVGNTFSLLDPAGSGRAVDLQFESGLADLVWGNGYYGKPDNDVYAVGGAMGTFIAENATLAGLNGVIVTEGWRSGNVDPLLYPNRAQALLANRQQREDLSELTRVQADMAASMGALNVTADGPNAGQFTAASAPGIWQISGTKIANTLTGGTLQISNLRVDLALGQVVVDALGTKSAIGTIPSKTFSNLNMVMWTFSPYTDVVGPASLNAEALLAIDPVAALAVGGFQADYVNGTCAPGDVCGLRVRGLTTLNNLSITTAGRNMVVNSLGLQSTGLQATDAVNTEPNKWGSITVATQFIMAVPEPATYALMGLGLVGVWAAARRCRVQTG